MRRLAIGMAILAFAGVALSWAVANDKEIAKEITERLKREQEAGKLEGFDINLKVAEGHVLLKGHVSTPEQQELALDIARQADGTKRVVNDLEVLASDSPTVADTEDAAALDDTTVAAALATSLRKLKDSGGLNGFRISFDVTDGTVVMKGKVASDEQRKLAVETAKSTMGVRKVVNHLVTAQKQPLPEPRDEPIPIVPVAQTESADIPDEDAIKDTDIARQIARQLRNQQKLGTLKQFQIDITVEDGIVVYEGRVSSIEQLGFALDIARNTDGVRDIVNHMIVVRPELVTKCDADSGSEAEGTRISDRNVVTRLVGASAELTRSGTDAQTAEYTPTPAETVGEAANAIYQPEAQTAIAPEVIAHDQRIGKELVRKLQEAKQQGGLRGFGIGVHVNDGTVRLAGRVSSPEQQHLALEIARRIRGVQLVVNGLEVVEPLVANPPACEPINREPEAIVRAISERLQAEDKKGNLRGCDFDVEVDTGDVWLTGQVASKEQEKLALDTARDVPGVKRAMSALEITAPEADPANVEVSTEAIVDTRTATAATASLRPQIGQPARLGISPNVLSTLPARSASAGNLPPMAPTAAYVTYPAAQLAANSAAANQTPRPLGLAQMVSYAPAAALAAPLVAMGQATGAMPAHLPGPGRAVVPARYDHPNLPGYAWPSYSAHPNYAGVTYPKQYSPTAWPYIGPFYPYPQVPLGWRRVVLKWDDGWWQMNFKSK